MLPMAYWKYSWVRFSFFLLQSIMLVKRQTLPGNLFSAALTRADEKETSRHLSNERLAFSPSKMRPTFAFVHKASTRQSKCNK